ncbi:MAG TPA: polysaccharide biosynthesis tyrosine autokinase [Alphaproteobacteria bacterium]|jgi:exopolysaccharide transport family protein
MTAQNLHSGARDGRGSDMRASGAAAGRSQGSQFSGAPLWFWRGAKPLGLPELTRVVQRRLSTIVGTIVAVTGLAILVAFQLTPQYDAEAVVVLDSRQERVSNVQDVVSGLPTDNAALRSELDVLMSRPLAAKVVEQTNLLNEPEFNPYAKQTPSGISRMFFWLDESSQLSFDQWFRGIFDSLRSADKKTPEQQAAETMTRVVDEYLKHLTVSSDGRSLSIRLVFRSDNPQLAARVVNTHADLYLYSQLEAKFDATKRANTWLTQRVDELRGQVRTAEQAVQAYREQNKLVGATQDASVYSQQLSDMSTQLIQARAERSQFESRLNQAKNQVNIDSMPEVLNSVTIQRLREQETQGTRTEADLAQRYGEKHPALLAARTQLRDVRAQIANEIKKIVASLTNNVESARARENALQKNVDELMGKVSNVNMAEVKLRELEREAEASRALFQNFLNRFRETSAGPSVDTPDARIVSPADVPLKASFPRKGLLIGAGFLLSLLCAAVMAALVEKFEAGFRSPEEIERAIGVASLGLVPAVPGGLTSSMPAESYVVEKPLSSYAEAIRSIRTAITFTDFDNPPRSIAVTSSVPDEGKTTLALSLARSSALAKRRTILVDCDLRRGGVAELLGVKAEPHIVDFLNGTCPLDRLIQTEESTGLHFIPAPNNVGNSLDLLNSSQYSNLIEALTQAYDCVIIDTPPVLAVSDALAIARRVDATVFAVRWGHTPENVVENAIKQIRSANLNLTGVVVTRVNLKKHLWYGYGDRGYYYGKYSGYYKA